MKNEIFHNDPNASKLLKAVETGEMVVFIGSGLSTGPDADGYPSWPQLVEKLCQKCHVDYSGEINRLSTPCLLQDLADQARKNSISAYTQVITDEFGKRVMKTIRAYSFLMRTRFRSYVTTNFDPQLAIAHEEHKATNLKLYVYPEIKSSAVSYGGVFYIHGYVAQDETADPDRIVLAKSDFAAPTAYGDDEKGDLIRFWHNLLLENHVLFVGCQLGEPEFEWVFAGCSKVEETRRKRFGLDTKSRFTLMPAESVTTDSLLSTEESKMAKEFALKADKRLTDYRITAVRYDPRDSNYSGLLDVLEEFSPRPNVIRYKEEPLESAE